MKPKSWVDGYAPLKPDNPAFEDYVNQKINNGMKETP